MAFEFWVAGLVGLAATIEDIRRRTISNWLPVTALLGGVAAHTVEAGWKGMGISLAGAGAGFLVFLVFYVVGGMGGGDVKLMAGFGALLGWGRILEAAFWVALAGGVLAAVMIGFSALRARLGPAQNPDRSGWPAAVPYAPAIVTGVWLTLWTGN